MTFLAGQALTTDQDFEAAIKTKENVVAYQGSQRLRPVSTVTQYNHESVKLADGTTILRIASVIRTLNDEEKLSYLVGAKA
ncbi:hypothetical protein [Paenibacillus aceris]|uniref:Uncharacterized protein n=1 Tax=Paenibacillus aceris TaxID=869555 RepID=A0ABS4I882_9BACL|nr:hypothetical protein [Paenibacillus aceris]MBP1967139.1 hypothetical protein [Paenibacillus aceris]NHW35544.1 hypothetical protein [Paenibacillus aceris]